MWPLRVLNHRAAIAPLALASVLLTAQAPLPEPVTDTETELGQAVYDELKTKGEIIASSPLYDTLGPVVEPIAKVAQAHYEHPFKFFLVHEAQPNAFSVPGGNVYVTDSLLYFVKNKEELAGTLCHELAHTINHDAMTKVQESRKVLAREVGTAILLGPTLAKAIAIGMIGDLHSQAYSRDIENGGRYWFGHMRRCWAQSLGSGLAVSGLPERGSKADSGTPVRSSSQRVQGQDT